jgi:cobalt-zinc-cadmium efflux system outer membrane protein
MHFWSKYLTTFLLLASCLHISAQERYTLKEALKTAKTNNLELHSERFNLDIAETEITTAKLRPNLNLSVEAVQIMNSSEFDGNTNWNNSQNREEMWQVSKPFQIAGQRKNKIELANKNFELEEKLFIERKRNLFSEVATQWLEIWTAKKQLEIIETAKFNIDTLLQTNQARYRNQVITKTDLFRTELLAKQYSVLYKSALQEVATHQKKFKFLLGANESVDIDPEDKFLFSISENLEVLLQEALGNRSDIQAAKVFSEVSNSNIKLQKSFAYPQPELGLIYNPQNSVPRFGISAAIDLPFFDRNQGEIKKSRLLKEQADQEVKMLQSKIENEINIAFSNFQLQKENLEKFQELMEQSQSILDNVKYAYLKGGTTIIDFLEAQRSWLEIQQDYYQTIREYRQAYIDLLYTTGLINQLAQ